MKRTFITAISLQPNNNLKQVVYEPVEFALKKNTATSFPIIPIIREYQGTNEKNVEVIAILPDSVNAESNYKVFLKELEGCGILEDQVNVIRTGKDQSRKSSLKMLMALLDQIPEDAIVFADITYNTKPMSAMVLYAMEFIEKMKDVEVEGIYYGELARDREGKPSGTFLYNITEFKHMSSILEQLQILGVKDLQKTMSRLIGE